MEAKAAPAGNLSQEQTGNKRRLSLSCFRAVVLVCEYVHAFYRIPPTMIDSFYLTGKEKRRIGFDSTFFFSSIFLISHNLQSH